MPVIIPRTVNVIEMYDHNSVQFDFAALKNRGVYAVIHRATSGLHYIDSAYAVRRAPAEAAGLLWGATHFLTSNDAEEQAAFFLGDVNSKNSGPCLLACEFDKSTRQPTLQQCMKFMRAVDQGSQPGVQCVLYSGSMIRETLKLPEGGHQDSAMHGAEIFFQQHRLWSAEYGPKENIPWPWNEPIAKTSDQSAVLPAPGVWMWQHPNKEGGGNFFNGTVEQLRDRWLS